MAASDDDSITAFALAAGRGDSAALEHFIRGTQRDVWRFCAHLANVGSADDLTQETYLRALRSLPRFSARSSARVWLLSIARRVVVDQVRSDRARPQVVRGIEIDDSIDHLRARRFEGIVELNMLMAGLESDRREALFLTQVLGMPYAEAAAVCNCAIGTIRSRVSRARSDLIAMTSEDGTADGVIDGTG